MIMETNASWFIVNVMHTLVLCCAQISITMGSQITWSLFKVIYSTQVWVFNLVIAMSLPSCNPLTCALHIRIIFIYQVFRRFYEVPQHMQICTIKEHVRDVLDEYVLCPIQTSINIWGHFPRLCVLLTFITNVFLRKVCAYG